VQLHFHSPVTYYVVKHRDSFTFFTFLLYVSPKERIKYVGEDGDNFLGTWAVRVPLGSFHCICNDLVVLAAIRCSERSKRKELSHGTEAGREASPPFLMN
jgi:hypothetical protein